MSYFWLARHIPETVGINRETDMRHAKWGFCVIFLVSTFAGADTVILNAGGVTKLDTDARDTALGLGGSVSSKFPAALPFIDSDTVTNGRASSTTTYNFSEGG